MGKKKTPFNVERTIRGAIRRVFVRSPVIREVMQAVRREVPRHTATGARHKKDSVQYQCAVCQDWFAGTFVSVDHKEPVIPKDGTPIDYNTFVDRLFCTADNLQVICDCCHEAKTYAERIDRLSKKYTAELDAVSAVIFAECCATMPKDKQTELKAVLRRCMGTKRTPELKHVADRASKLLEVLKRCSTLK